jgi:hypothetical protein
MGSRANLVILRDGGMERYYTHRDAQLLDVVLFWGPALALAWIREQSPNEGPWLDIVWAEGGVVIDPVHQTVLWWGGDGLVFDVPEQRVVLALMRQLWQGWEVRWAHEGVADLADAVGAPRADLLATRPPQDSGAPLSPPDDPDGVDTVLSVRRVDHSTAHFPLGAMNIERVLFAQNLLSAADFGGGTHLDLRRHTSFPTGGAVVDVARRTVSFWSAPDVPDAEALVCKQCPGWQVAWHRDRYESQLEAVDGLTFPDIDVAAVLARLRARLVNEDVWVTTPPSPAAGAALIQGGESPLLAHRKRAWAQAVARASSGGVSLSGGPDGPRGGPRSGP